MLKFLSLVGLLFLFGCSSFATIENINKSIKCDVSFSSYVSLPSKFRDILENKILAINSYGKHSYKCDIKFTSFNKKDDHRSNRFNPTLIVVTNIEMSSVHKTNKNIKKVFKKLKLSDVTIKTQSNNNYLIASKNKNYSAIYQSIVDKITISLFSITNK
jgi:hypothetical protein